MPPCDEKSAYRLLGGKFTLWITFRLLNPPSDKPLICSNQVLIYIN